MLVSKLTAHTDNAATVIAPVLVTVPTNVLTLLVVTVVLFVVSPLLAVVALVAAPVSAAVSVVIARKARPFLETRWTTTAALTGHIEEELSARRMLQAYNAEPPSPDAVSMRSTGSCSVRRVPHSGPPAPSHPCSARSTPSCS